MKVLGPQIAPLVVIVQFCFLKTDFSIVYLFIYFNWINALLLGWGGG